jgi:hypothetical protein
MTAEINLIDILGPDGYEPTRQADRVVTFEIDDDGGVFVREACDEYFGVAVTSLGLARLLLFLQARLRDLNPDVDGIPVGFHLSGCCHWPPTVTTTEHNGVTWTTTRCGRCSALLSTFADGGALDIGIVPPPEAP